MYIFVFLLRNSDLNFFRRVCTLFYIRKRFIRTFMMKLAKKLRMSQEYCHLKFFELKIIFGQYS